MKLRTLFEAAPSDLMPASDDPYVGMQDQPSAGTDMPIEPPEALSPEMEPAGIEASEPEPAPLEPAGAIEEPQDLGIEADEGAGAVEEAPTSWTVEPSIDRRDISYSHPEGFYLRMRELATGDGRWVVQLYNNEERILDKGIADIPSGIDPALYIQDLADRMLDLTP